ncbi:MAG TPA: hypothetical protein DD473_26360 [Planctomycetaceae bacterium]|nr:hypothetical protein [Planctomycetaceae bacterium]
MTVEVLDTAYQLDQQYGFWSTGDYYQNYHGMQEKWIGGQNNHWYYLLENGDLYFWSGSFESSVLIETLDTSYYENPDLLIHVEPIQVTAEFIDGQLIINRSLLQTTAFSLRVMISDGIATTEQLITFEIEQAE